MKKQDPQAKLFEKFIADKKIVIADKSATSRAALGRTLSQMGARTTSMALASTYNEAEAEITRVKPHVVLCDYDLGKRCGLDLLQKQRNENPDSKTSLFILVTGNSSQSAVAKAAEEDVDTYVLKPFTAEVLRQSILRTALAKIDPPEYIRIIERGKTELLEGKFDDAIKSFGHAIKLDPAPALAYFYLGQASLMKQLIDDAEGSYLKGLEVNKIHYRCLVGLFEVLMARKRFGDAYTVIKKISQYFPANPQRMTSVLRLAIMNKAYEDVERYYQIFTGIDDRNEEMIKYVCAALVVCGKYYLGKKFNSRAMELFQKAATTAQDRTRILREIITSLVEEGLARQAEEYLKKFPPKTQSSNDYLAMELLVLDKTGGKSPVIAKGRELIAKGIHDPMIYETVIRRSLEANFVDAAEDLARTAIQKWPDQEKTFKRWLDMAEAKQAK